MSNPIEGLLTKEQTDLIFNNMSDGVNELVSELSGNRPGIETASQ